VKLYVEVVSESSVSVLIGVVLLLVDDDEGGSVFGG
jgi:hypothetical protein